MELMILLQIIWFYGIKTFFINDKRTKFLLPLLVSPILSICPILYYYGVVSDIWIVSFCQSYLINDIMIGFMEYPEVMFNLEGVYHHIVYICVNLIVFNVPEYAGVYVWYFFVEVPTSIRAIGYVFPRFRSDLLFGICMVIFRVIYHIFLIFYFNEILIINSVSVCALTAHIYWTFNWVKLYCKKNIDKS